MVNCLLFLYQGSFLVLSKKEGPHKEGISNNFCKGARYRQTQIKQPSLETRSGWQGRIKEWRRKLNRHLQAWQKRTTPRPHNLESMGKEKQTQASCKLHTASKAPAVLLPDLLIAFIKKHLSLLHPAYIWKITSTFILGAAWRQEARYTVPSSSRVTSPTHPKHALKYSFV